MLSIEELLQEVFDKFEKYLDGSNELCILKEVNFKKGKNLITAINTYSNYIC